MKAVAQASQTRSLADFQAALKEYNKELELDVIVEAHLDTLYDTMLEQNLCRIIEPYSRVEVSVPALVLKKHRNYILTFHYRCPIFHNRLSWICQLSRRNCHK